MLTKVLSDMPLGLMPAVAEHSKRTYFAKELLFSEAASTSLCGVKNLSLNKPAPACVA
jgi:hypothetical protein